MQMDAVITIVLQVKFPFIGYTAKTNILVSQNSGWSIKKEGLSFLNKNLSSFGHRISMKTVLKEILKYNLYLYSQVEVFLLYWLFIKKSLHCLSRNIWREYLKNTNGKLVSTILFLPFTSILFLYLISIDLFTVLIFTFIYLYIRHC